MVEILGAGKPKQPTKFGKKLVKDDMTQYAYYMNLYAVSKDPEHLRLAEMYKKTAADIQSNFNKNWFPKKQQGKNMDKKSKEADGENINGIGFNPSWFIWGGVALLMGFAVFGGKK